MPRTSSLPPSLPLCLPPSLSAFLPPAFFASEFCRSGNNRGAAVAEQSVTQCQATQNIQHAAPRRDRHIALLACMSVCRAYSTYFFHGRGTHTELFRVARAKGMKRRIALPGEGSQRHRVCFPEAPARLRDFTLCWMFFSLATTGFLEHLTMPTDGALSTKCLQTPCQ